MTTKRHIPPDGSPCTVITVSVTLNPDIALDIAFGDDLVWYGVPEEGGGVQVGLALVAAQAVLVERPGLRVHPLLLENLDGKMNAIVDGMTHLTSFC